MLWAYKVLIHAQSRLVGLSEVLAGEDECKRRSKHVEQEHSVWMSEYNTSGEE